MPAQICQPLAVLFTVPGDGIYRRRLDDLPNQVLATGLAQGLVAATHPHGPIRTRSVALQYVQTVRRMVRELHAQGFTAAITELRAATLVQHWLTCDYHRERRLRVVLDAYQASHGGLDPDVVRHLSGRRINKMFKSRPNQPYSDGEWQRLGAVCAETIQAAAKTHREALEAAGRGGDPGDGVVTGETLARQLLEGGPLSADIVLGRPELVAHRLSARAPVAQMHRALFPSANVALAYLTLFAMRTGIVPDGIDTLRIQDITRTSTQSVLLSYRKGRTGGEALALPRDAVRVLDRWLEHSAPLREHAGDLADRLWVHTGGDSRGYGLTRIFAQPRTQGRRREWVTSTGLLGDDGRILSPHGGRVRATYHHRRDRSAWTGRTTIDPNHSAQVEGDHYLSSHTPAQLDALEGIIETAQREMRDKGVLPPVVLTLSTQDTAAFASRFPRLVQDAGLDTSTIAALLSGEQDVFVAACASPLNSPHAPAGTWCPARPWVCLLCPLAAFTPRHLPNLLRLKDYFSAQATQMSIGQFLQVFGPYATRLTEDVLPRFSVATLEDATRKITEPGGLLLHLEEHAE